MQFIVDSIAGDVNNKKGIVTSIISYVEGGEIDLDHARNWIVNEPWSASRSRAVVFTPFVCP